MKLRALREAKGISQTTLAKKARVSRGHLNRLEAGQYDPTVGVLTRIARALGVDVKEMLG